MGLSIDTTTYTGGTQTFPISFALGYADRDDVVVFVVGETDGAGEQLYRDFTWNSDSEILVTDPLTIGDKVTRMRTVSKTVLVADYTAPGSATRANLQATATQAMMALHEVLDGRILESYEGLNTIQDFVDRAREDAERAETAAGEAETAAGEAETSAASMDSAVTDSAASADLAEAWAQSPTAPAGVPDTMSALTAAQVAIGAALHIQSLLADYTGAYSSRAIAIATTIPAAQVTLSYVQDGKRFDFASSASGTAIVQADGRTWAPAGTVYAEHYGAIGDGVTDDTVPINAATAATTGNVHLLEKSYYITDGIKLKQGQFLISSNRWKAQLVVSASFNFSAKGVVYTDRAVTGGGVKGIGFVLAQPASPANRAACNQYPPAIYLDYATRWLIEDVNIAGAWDGVVLKDNCGGTTVRNLEVGALNKGFTADGCYDFVHINTLHFWPFGINTAADLYNNIYSDGETIAMQIGRIDGVDFHGITSFRGKVVINGESYGTVNGLNLDGKGSNLQVSDGHLAIAGLNNGTSNSLDTVIALSGSASLAISASNLKPNYTVSGTPNNPFITVTGTSTLTMSTTSIYRGYASQTIFSQSGGNMHLNDIFFNYGINEVRTAPWIKVSAGRVSLDNIHFPDKGTGSGNAIEIDNDDHHNVNIAQTVGWTIGLPATPVLGYYNIKGVVSALRVPGPFNDDIAAAAANVGIGGSYRKTGGTTAWRVS